MEENRFIIVAPSRTGSTLMRRMLNKLPNVVCHGELYGLKRILGLSHKIKSEHNKNGLLQLRLYDEEKFWKEVEFESHKLTGIKILYPQLFNFIGSDILALARNNPKIKIIHLWRNDLEARHYSEIILKYQKKIEKSVDKNIEIEHMCNVEQIFSEAKRLINTGNLVIDVFRDNPVFNVAYEDFVKDKSVRDKLLEFLGIEDEQNKFILPEERISYDNKNVNIKLINQESVSEQFNEQKASLPKMQFQ